MASEFADDDVNYDENDVIPGTDDNDAMAQENDNIEGEGEDEDEGPNPGDEVMWFGKHVRMKYDDLPTSYINWLVNEFLKNPESASLNIKDFKTLYDRKQVWIQKKETKTPPGKVVMWFGKHEGITFDALEDGYVMSLVNMYYKERGAARQDARFQNLRKFKELYDRYNSWLVVEQIRTWKSPGSIPIWFGQDKGREFRQIYKAQPRKWRWLLKNCRWAPVLKAIAAEYEEWLKTHLRQRPASRSAPVIVNPVGERLGPGDDGAASDNGSYESDDGFVVRDEDTSLDVEETQEVVTDEDAGEDSTTRDCENNTNATPFHSRTPESDDELFPTLEEVLKGAPSKPCPSEPKPPSVSAGFPVSAGSGDESEEVISPRKRRVLHKSFSAEKNVVISIDSDEEPPVLSERNDIATEEPGKPYLSPPETQEVNMDHESRDKIGTFRHQTKEQDNNLDGSDSDAPLPSRGGRTQKNKTFKNNGQATADPDSSDSGVILTLQRRNTSRKRARNAEGTDSETILTSPIKGRKKKRQTRGEGVKA